MCLGTKELIAKVGHKGCIGVCQAKEKLRKFIPSARKSMNKEGQRGMLMPRWRIMGWGGRLRN